MAVKIPMKYGLTKYTDKSVPIIWLVQGKIAKTKTEEREMKNAQTSKKMSDMFCSTTILLFCLLSSSKVDAWGGLFNRFNPSMLSNLGYGGSSGGYGKELYSVAHSGVIYFLPIPINIYLWITNCLINDFQHFVLRIYIQYFTF